VAGESTVPRRAGVALLREGIAERVASTAPLREGTVGRLTDEERLELAERLTEGLDERVGLALRLTEELEERLMDGDELRLTDGLELRLMEGLDERLTDGLEVCPPPPREPPPPGRWARAGMDPSSIAAIIRVIIFEVFIALLLSCLVVLFLMQKYNYSLGKNPLYFHIFPSQIPIHSLSAVKTGTKKGGKR
jgi:hypothetical protein